ncbi:phenylacetate--CoA ligase [Desulfovibrio sp. OttesenSCG-928-M14]|nr:phenylacetate--CoA ligase [Desulfovibrio sp. OttesenSCG-928-M14]
MNRFIPHYSQEELLRLQENGLRWTVLHAYARSPQYRKKFQDAGIDPAAVTGLEDLPHLPLTTTEDLRDGYPLPLLSVPESEVVRVHASSGTTGKRKILAYTQKDVDTFALQMARCFELAGLTPQDRVQIAVGYGLWTAGAGFQLGCEQFGALTVPVGAGNLEIHLQMLADMGSTCLCSTASMALLMGEEVQRHGLADKLRLRTLIFGAEGHNMKMRRVFERDLGLDESFDIGGMTEMYGPGSALECRAHEGLHYWADLFIIEILDPATLLPVNPGEVGEMVVTSLSKEASPLVRYRTRDLTRLLPAPCACGCSMPRHDHLVGRSDDMIIFRGVNMYPGQIADVLQDFPELGSEYHIHLTRENGRDSMRLQIERADHASSDIDEGLARQVAKTLQARVLVSACVEIANPGVLPRSFGKSRRVTDSRF